MADQVMVTKAKLDSLAEVVSAKSGEPLTLTIDGMVDAVLDMELGITPSGTKRITANGMHDVTEYADAYVAVQPELQTLNVTPGIYSQQFNPDYGYDGFSEVYVEPVSRKEVIFTPSTAIQYAVPNAADQRAFLPKGFALNFLTSSSQSSVSVASYTLDLTVGGLYIVLGSFDLIFNNVVQQRLFVYNTWQCYAQTTTSSSISFEVETQIETPSVILSSLNLSKNSLSGIIQRINSAYGTASLVSNGFQVLRPANFIGFSKVTVNPIPSNYGRIAWDGSAITVY